MAEPDDGSFGLGLGILNRKPLVLHVIWPLESPFPFLEALSLKLGATPALILVTNYWSILARWKSGIHFFDEYLKEYRSHRLRYPNHHVVLLANDRMEEHFIKAHGVETVLFQQNGFMHPYESGRATAKEFDAIYIARIERYKRFELAHKIKSCCVIFGSANREYYTEIGSSISHFTFANGDPTDSLSEYLLFSETPLLSRTELASWCARARAGLCLSFEEGAMWASAEYMVWGLPIVTTRSIGGRDEYFDDRFWIVCDDNPDSVAAAVQELISRNIDPEFIRHAFLAKVMARRAHLLEFIISKTNEWEGSLETFIGEWLNISTPFLDRRRWFSAPELMQELQADREEVFGENPVFAGVAAGVREEQPDAQDCLTEKSEKAPASSDIPAAGSGDDRADQIAALARSVEKDRAEFSEFRRTIETALGIGWEELQALKRRVDRKRRSAIFHGR